MDPALRNAPVERAMQPEVVTVPPDETLGAAASTMLERGVRHLPVLNDRGELLGILSERDLRTALGTALVNLAHAGSRIYDIVQSAMAPDPIVLHPDSPLSKAIEVFEDERVGAIPILNREDRLVGMLSYIDVLDWLSRQKGPARPAEASPYSTNFSRPEQDDLTPELSGFDAPPAQAEFGSVDPPELERMVDAAPGTQDIEEEPTARDIGLDRIERAEQGEPEEEERVLSAQPTERPRVEPLDFDDRPDLQEMPSEDTDRASLDPERTRK